jgi:hypothetical protein
MVGTTGAKPDMLNVLSTDEVSLAIRPDVLDLNMAYIDKSQAVFHNSKIYFAVPHGATDNNEIWVLDLELKTWIRPWLLPVGRFVVYTSDDGVTRLLYRPNSLATDQSHLVEISDAYDTDNGVEFPVNLSTALIQFDSSHFAFERVKKVYFEMLRAKGNIDITISGVMKNREIQVLKSFHIQNQESYTGFDNEMFDISLFDLPSTVPVVYLPTYIKKVMKVAKTLNNVQINIDTTSKSDWSLSVVSIVGVPKRVSDPSKWKK